MWFRAKITSAALGCSAISTEFDKTRKHGRRAKFLSQLGRLCRLRRSCQKFGSASCPALCFILNWSAGSILGAKEGPSGKSRSYVSCWKTKKPEKTRSEICTRRTPRPGFNTAFGKIGSPSLAKTASKRSCGKSRPYVWYCFWRNVVSRQNNLGGARV